MNPFGMCQTVEIKAKRELHKNEPPRKIKEICVLCKIDQIRILGKKKTKKQKERRKIYRTWILCKLASEKSKIAPNKFLLC
jgi:DNA topoisomerase IA